MLEDLLRYEDSIALIFKKTTLKFLATSQVKNPALLAHSIS